MSLLKNKILRISVLSIFTGTVIMLAEYSFIDLIIVKGKIEWTSEIGDKLFWGSLILAIVLFFITAILCLRDMTKKEILKSAVIVMIYYILLVILERIFLNIGLSSVAFMYLHVPVRIYSTIRAVLAGVTGLSSGTAGLFSYIWFVFDFASPFLYVPFGKNDIERG